MAGASGQQKAGAKAAPERPVLWRVVGGASSGGLVVREGAKISSAELPEKLATGAIIHEVESAGERLRYRRLKGAGPETGWVSTSFKGKELLARYRLRVWVLACGSRGDVQPYLALAVGLMRAGFDAVLWSHSDFRSYAEPYGLPFRDLNPPSEKINRTIAGVEGADEASARCMLFWARFCLSFLSKAPVGGVAYWDAIPKDVVLPDVGGAHQLVVGLLEKAARKGDQDAAGCLTGHLRACEAIGAEAAAAQATAPAEAEREPVGAPAPAAAASRPQREWPFERGSAEWEMAEEMARTDFTDMQQMFRFGEIVSRVGAFASDPALVETMRRELEQSPPDAVAANPLLVNLGLQIAKRCDCPWFYLGVCPHGFNLDVDGKWVTEKEWPVLQSMRPELYQYASLQEARQAHRVDDDSPLASAPLFQLLQVAEEVLLRPIFGTTAVRDGGLEWLHERFNRGSLVGFSTAVAGERFLQVLGERSRRAISAHVYCGAWALGEEDQRGGAADAFGGAELRSRVERFLEAGPKPVYVGFGSCFSTTKGKGRHWMVTIAVSSLMLAGVRGIILGGWADLSLELLQETVGEDDAFGLVAYAREKILFVPKISQAWLFPRCSVLLIHGGIGTLSAAWLSGVPTIVWPVWMDQPTNGILHSLLGAGSNLPTVETSDPQEVAKAIKSTLESEEALVAARMMQFTVMKDRGVQKVVETFDQHLVHEARCSFA